MFNLFSSKLSSLRGISIRRVTSTAARVGTIALLAALMLVGLPAPRVFAATQTCDEAGLDAALAAGGMNNFSCAGATTITVSGAKTVSVSGTILDGSNRLTISGGSLVQVFIVDTNMTATFQNLTIANGKADNGGGIFINLGGTANVNNSTLSGNSVTTGGGGIYNATSTGTLNISNSTFSNNSATSGGGGIANAGTVMINNSTFSGNSTAGAGGGVANFGGTVTISYSTFSGNSATGGGGGIYNASGTSSLENTIVANSTSGGNCSGAITDSGNNLQFGGTVVDSCGAAIPTADPKLGSLVNNGGPTQTMALGAGSPAIDAIATGTHGCTPGTSVDQRNAQRANGVGHGGTACDIGAYESDSSAPTAVKLSSFKANTPSFDLGAWLASLFGR